MNVVQHERRTEKQEVNVVQHERRIEGQEINGLA